MSEGCPPHRPVPASISEAAALMEAGVWTCRELTTHFLRGIKALNPQLAALITITAESALREADALDHERRAGRVRGPLHGIAVVNKDLFGRTGVPCTVGSPLFRDRLPETDAAVIERLRAAGCVFLGQANMSEFAAVPKGSNRTYGDAMNPWKAGHSPGASSSGSAAAVAAGLCLAATGSDTGGSVRNPASFCGLVGLRPTHGLVSLHGAFPRAPSLDTPCVLTRTVRDTALLLGCLAGYDPRDAHSITSPSINYADALSDDLSHVRVALVEDYSLHNTTPAVQAAVQRAAKVLEAQGATIRTLSVPFLSRPNMSETLYTVLACEFSRHMEPLFRTTRDKSLFDPCVLADIENGLRIPEQQYQAAQRRRQADAEAFMDVFAEVDMVLTPSVPTAAPAYNASETLWNRHWIFQFLLPFSYLGLPALSMPCGLDDGLPMGVQLVGPPRSEALLLRAGGCLEEAAGMPAMRPPLFWHG